MTGAGDAVHGWTADDPFTAAHAARLARIREQVRHGVWALRHEAELQAHWEALGREMRGDGVAAGQGEIGATALRPA